MLFSDLMTHVIASSWSLQCQNLCIRDWIASLSWASSHVPNSCAIECCKGFIWMKKWCSFGRAEAEMSQLLWHPSSKWTTHPRRHPPSDLSIHPLTHSLTHPWAEHELRLRLDECDWILCNKGCHESCQPRSYYVMSICQLPRKFFDFYAQLRSTWFLEKWRQHFYCMPCGLETF